MTGVATLNEAARLALALPEVVEAERHSRRAFLVNGKVFAWERAFSKADLKRFGDEPAPDGDILAVNTADLGEKEAALAAGHAGIFTIPHFNGYAAVLVHLRVVARPVLRETLVDGWLVHAPAALAEEYLRRRRSRPARSPDPGA